MQLHQHYSILIYTRVSNDDPSVVTSFIDLQSASVEPAFWYTDEVPDFATIVTEPGDDKNGHKNEELCSKAFDVCTRSMLPKIGSARAMDENIFRPFRYSQNTWNNGAVSFRHDLIETSKDWQYLGFTGTCPYSLPPTDRLDKQKQEYEYFKDVHMLKRTIAKGLRISSDSWVPPESWELTNTAQKELFNDLLKTTLKTKDPDPDDPLKNEEDARAIWPHDI